MRKVSISNFSFISVFSIWNLVSMLNFKSIGALCVVILGKCQNVRFGANEGYNDSRLYYLCSCVHVCACVCMCVHVCACVCMCVHVCACVCMCVHVLVMAVSATLSFGDRQSLPLSVCVGSRRDWQMSATIT